MRKAFSLLAVFMVAALWSSTGFSADRYVSGNIGISWMNDLTTDYVYSREDYNTASEVELDSGVSLLGALGCDYGDYRLEAELGYQTSDIDAIAYAERDGDLGDPYDFEGDVSVTTLLANGYYDIDLGGSVECYLTAGAGVAQIDLDDVRSLEEDIDDDLVITVINRFGDSDPDYTFNASETALAYQIGAGIAIPVSGGIMLDARYRYFATTDFTVENENMNIESHSALVGLRVSL